MHKRLKWMIAILAVALISLMLAGCGGDDSDDGGEGEGESEGEGDDDLIDGDSPADGDEPTDVDGDNLDGDTVDSDDSIDGDKPDGDLGEDQEEGDKDLPLDGDIPVDGDMIDGDQAESDEPGDGDEESLDTEFEPDVEIESTSQCIGPCDPRGSLGNYLSYCGSDEELCVCQLYTPTCYFETPGELACEWTGTTCSDFCKGIWGGESAGCVEANVPDGDFDTWESDMPPLMFDSCMCTGYDPGPCSGTCNAWNLPFIQFQDSYCHDDQYLCACIYGVSLTKWHFVDCDQYCTDHGMSSVGCGTVSFQALQYESCKCE